MKWYRLYKESDDSDFVIEDGVLKKYKGKGGDVVIPDSVTSIGKNAFYDCNSLTSVTIPNTVTSIEKYAFMYCESLTSLTLGNGVTSIGTYAFFGCDGLTSVTIPNSVTNIGDSAFWNCNNLTSVTIGVGVTSIGVESFAGCKNLKSIQVKGKTNKEAKDMFGDAVDDISIVHGEQTKYTIDYTAWHMDKYTTEITADSKEDARRKFLRDEAQEQYDMKDFEITSIREF